MSHKFVKGLSKLCKNTTGEEKLQLDINDVIESLKIPCYATAPTFPSDNKAYLYFNTTSKNLKIQYNGTAYTYPHN